EDAGASGRRLLAAAIAAVRVKTKKEALLLESCWAEFDRSLWQTYTAWEASGSPTSRKGKQALVSHEQSTLLRSLLRAATIVRDTT
ncbi:unnamed protein product, partial [Polarella glacialis]